jgi:hypothetical protein
MAVDHETDVLDPQARLLRFRDQRPLRRIGDAAVEHHDAGLAHDGVQIQREPAGLEVFGA